MRRGTPQPGWLLAGAIIGLVLTVALLGVGIGALIMW